MHTQQEAFTHLNEANDAKSVCNAWWIAVGTFKTQMEQYRTACQARREAVASSISIADVVFVDNCLAQMQNDIQSAGVDYTTAGQYRASGLNKYSQAEQAYKLNNQQGWDFCYEYASQAILNFTNSNTSSTSAKNKLESAREQGIQAMARINSYALGNPPDPGEPTAPTVPTGP